mgnify:CR=1 FL=1
MSASRPNVLLLLTDQERADLVAPDGLPVETPNIDRLRQQGMWFSSAYTPTSICTSARASLLTGRYPHAHGLLNNSHEADAIRTDLPEGLPTLGELLADSGYTNTYLGKWHVSHNHTPGDFGFRYFGGSDYHHDNFEVAFEHYRESHGIRVPETDVEDRIYTGTGDDGTLVAGTDPVPVEAEKDRVLPVVERINDLDALVSVDTRKAEVARAALDAGADILNDVSGLEDPEMRLVASEYDVPVIVMHSIDAPVVPDKDVHYDDVVEDVIDSLIERVLLAEKAGLDRSQIIVDPGLGFGKTSAESFELLDRIGEFRGLDCPVLVGHSHKSMFELVDRGADERYEPTIAATTLAAQRGADIVRVHDVAANRAAVDVVETARDPDDAD